MSNLFQKNIDISSFTTFGIPVKAALFAEYSDLKELREICRSEEFAKMQHYHIGGGSNLLFLHDFNGIVLHSAIRGLQIYKKDDTTAFVIAGAGERWTDFVDFCVANGLAGVENLAGIPGEVGAAPVQNVGAYGVEAADVIHTVECYDLKEYTTVTFHNFPGRTDLPPEIANECGFSYRNSNFKTIWRGRYIVLRVSFRLTISEEATTFTHAALKDFRNQLGRTPTIAEIRDEIIRVRASKLPDPALCGSAGSFFKNPVVRRAYFKAEVEFFASKWMDGEVKHYPDHYEGETEYVKLPAGWLIEKAGLKGARVGGAYVYPENCLVIANDGSATAEDVEQLASHVRHVVNQKFHVNLEREVNYVDTSISVTVLGSGTSKGVPELLCDCAVCRSENPLDHRRRASVLVQTMGLNILIDPTPDFRMQALQADIDRIDAVLVTHEHYDHVGGFDDLRPYCGNAPLDIYLRDDVNEKLHRRLDYCFTDKRYPGVPTFNMNVVSAEKPFEVKGVEIEPIEVLHGSHPIFGYRIGKFAYITDAKTISDDERRKLEGVEVLIVNALREREHFAHFTIAEALQLIEKVHPREAYLTHLCHEVGLHHTFDASLPANVHPAYDGMKIVVG